MPNNDAALVVAGPWQGAKVKAFPDWLHDSCLRKGLAKLPYLILDGKYAQDIVYIDPGQVRPIRAKRERLEG
jgi:hypothetical protein